MPWPRTQSRYDKTTSFTVLADSEQAERWAAAAHIQGHESVSAWLADTADAYMREVTKAGNPLPLSWYGGRFRVLIEPTSAKEPYSIEVKGRTSGPFGVFRGSLQGLDPLGASFSLVHIPTRRIIGTFPRQKDCTMLAAELMPLRINWEEPDPEKVILGTPDQTRVQAIIQLYKQISR